MERVVTYIYCHYVDSLWFFVGEIPFLTYVYHMFHFPCSVSWCLNSSKSHVHHISFFFMVKLNLVHPIFEIPWPFVLSVSSWLNLVFPRRPSKTLVSASAANAWRTCWIAWNGVRWTPRSCNRSWCWTHAWSNGPWCNVTLGLQWVGPHYIKGVLLFMFLCVVFCMYIHICIYVCVCVHMYIYPCVLLQLLLLNDLFKSWSAKNRV